MVISLDRKIIYAVIGLIIVVAAAAGGYYAFRPARVIKIGAVGPLSAPGASIQGIELKKGIEMAIEDVNEAGGVLGRKIELIFEDTMGMPEKGRAALEKLIKKDKVVGVVGEYHSSVVLAEIEVAHKYGIPFIDGSGWSDAIREKGYREVFATSPYNTGNAEHVARFIKYAGFRNIVCIAEDTDYGINLAERIGAALERLGVGAKYQYEVVSRTATDYTPTLLKYREMEPRPDLLVIAVTPPGGFLIIKQAYEIGLSPETICYEVTGAGDRYTELWPAVGEAGKYLIFFTPYNPSAKLTELGERVRAKYKEKYGEEPTYIVFNGYDCALAMIEAIKRAGSTDPDKIIAALEDLEIEGTRGIIKFSKESGPYWHQWLEVPVFTCQYHDVNLRNDEATILYPEKFATGKLIRPS